MATPVQHHAADPTADALQLDLFGEIEATERAEIVVRDYYNDQLLMPEAYYLIKSAFAA